MNLRIFLIALITCSLSASTIKAAPCDSLVICDSSLNSFNCPTSCLYFTYSKIINQCIQSDELLVKYQDSIINYLLMDSFFNDTGCSVAFRLIANLKMQINYNELKELVYKYIGAANRTPYEYGFDSYFSQFYDVLETNKNNSIMILESNINYFTNFSMFRASLNSLKYLLKFSKNEWYDKIIGMQEKAPDNMKSAYENYINIELK